MSGNQKVHVPVIFIPLPVQDFFAQPELLWRHPVAPAGPAVWGAGGDCGRTGAGVPG